jgi:hypothetical protein
MVSSAVRTAVKSVASSGHSHGTVVVVNATDAVAAVVPYFTTETSAPARHLVHTDERTLDLIALLADRCGREVRPAAGPQPGVDDRSSARPGMRCPAGRCPRRPGPRFLAAVAA